MSNQELLPWLSMVSNGWNRPIKVGQMEPEAIIVVLSSIPHLIHTLTIFVIAMRLQFVRIYVNLHHQKMSNVKTQVAFGHIFSQGLESVFIDGEDFTKAEGDDRKNILRKFGVLFQSSGLIASMSIAENIALVLETYTGLDKDYIYNLAMLKLDLVGLAGDFLRAGSKDGVAGVIELAETINDELRIAMFASGAADIDALAHTRLHESF